MPSRERRARGILNQAIAELPATTSLYDLDVRDELSDDQIERLLAGKSLEVENDLDDSFGWEMEADNVEGYVREVLPEEEDRELLRELDLLVHLEDEIRDRNTTGLLQLLLRHTSAPVLRFDLDLDVNPGLSFDGAEALEDAAREIAEVAGIDLDANRTPIMDLLLNASYGGGLQVLFSMDLELLVAALASDEPQQIAFIDPTLLVYDGLNGSGMEAQVTGAVVKPLRAEDLALDAGPYSWDDITGGHSRGDYDTPVEITTLPADTGGEEGAHSHG